ncbi:taurine ABC transporter substrate-binding protein [Chitinimonas sp.]|uniref:taurine ABC transporter substrate-binding protein n=1 Tax=Chitinimonas sp. TaxID=1934313 RepID=UPI002F92F039
MLKQLKQYTLAAALATAGLLAQAEDAVTIAYQTTVEPAKVAQADGVYEKATGKSIQWRKFESGADVITAVASGDVQIGYVGSSPLAAAASRSLPIQTFLIAAQIGTAEALVVRNGSGISKPQDLQGKKIAVPFVSTTHYSLLAALKHWKIDTGKVQILNLRPTEIAAAWQRGDIDAAYVWDPALGTAKANGKVLISSADVAKWGAPTFDAWIVRKDFADKNPDFVTQFAKVTGEYYARYESNPKAFGADKANTDKIARITGSKPEEVAELLAGNRYPTLKEQATLLGNGTVQAVAATSAFLKEQGKVDAVLPNYAPYVEAKFVKQASAAKVASK